MNHEPRSCRVCGEFYSATSDPPRLPKIFFGCGHCVCSACLESGTLQSEQEKNVPNVLQCPACHLETFLPIVMKRELHDEYQERVRKQEQEEKEEGVKTKTTTTTTTTPSPFKLSQSADNDNNNNKLISSKLPTNYELLFSPNNAMNTTPTSASFPLCPIHKTFRRGFFCPSHQEAICIHCAQEQHNSCPYRVCELSEAKPVLLQTLSHTKKTLANSLSRTEFIQDKLLIQQEEAEDKLFEAHCQSVFDWLNSCLEISFETLHEARKVHLERKQRLTDAHGELEKAQREIHACLRALDVAPELPPASLVEALPVLKSTVDIPDVALQEGYYKGIFECLEEKHNRNSNNNNNSGKGEEEKQKDSFSSSSSTSVEALSLLEHHRTRLPRMEPLFGERVLVADQIPFHQRQQQQQDQNNNSNNNQSYPSLALVDLESRKVISRIPSQNNINNSILQTPNGVAEIVLEIEVEDKSAAAGIFSSTFASASQSPARFRQQQMLSTTEKGENENNFYQIRVSDPAFDADLQVQKETEKDEKNESNTKTTHQEDPEDKFLDEQIEKEKKRLEQKQQDGENNNNKKKIIFRKKKVLQHEICICDTLGHRILVLDASTGNVSRVIRQNLRGSCINEFSPFGICAVPVKDERDSHLFGEGSTTNIANRHAEEKRRNEREQEELEKEKERHQQEAMRSLATSAAAAASGGTGGGELGLSDYLLDQQNYQEQEFLEKEREQQQRQQQQQRRRLLPQPVVTAALLVTDCDNHRVYLIDPDDGTFLKFWGGFRGSSHDEFWSPQGICQIRESMFAICDSNNHRLQILDVNHSGVLFCIDLFNHQFSSSASSASSFASPTSPFFNIQRQTMLMMSGMRSGSSNSNKQHDINLDHQRTFPSSVCVLPDNTRSVPDEQELLRSHETIQLAVACKMPTSKNDCVISITFSFDLTRVDQSEMINASAYLSNKSKSSTSSQQQRRKQDDHQEQQDQEDASLIQAAAVASKSSSPTHAVAFRLSKMKSSPPKTIFEAPPASSNVNNNSSGVNTSSSSSSQYVESVFDSLNSEWNRTVNVIERTNEQKATSSCGLCVSTTASLSSSMMMTAMKRQQQQQQGNWSERLFDDHSREVFDPSQSQGMSTRTILHESATSTHAPAVLSTVMLVISDRERRCLWLCDPCSGRLHDRIDGRKDNNSSDNNLFFNAPAFVLRVSPTTSLASSSSSSSSSSIQGPDASSASSLPPSSISVTAAATALSSPSSLTQQQQKQKQQEEEQQEAEKQRERIDPRALLFTPHKLSPISAVTPTTATSAATAAAGGVEEKKTQDQKGEHKNEKVEDQQEKEKEQDKPTATTEQEEIKKNEKKEEEEKKKEKGGEDQQQTTQQLDPKTLDPHVRLRRWYRKWQPWNQNDARVNITISQFNHIQDPEQKKMAIEDLFRALTTKIIEEDPSFASSSSSSSEKPTGTAATTTSLVSTSTTFPTPISPPSSSSADASQSSSSSSNTTTTTTTVQHRRVVLAYPEPTEIVDYVEQIAPMDVRSRLARFYTKHSPDYLQKLDSVLLRFTMSDGTVAEEELFRILSQRHGPEPEFVPPPPPSSKQTPPPILPPSSPPVDDPADDLEKVSQVPTEKEDFEFKLRLLRLYCCVNPEKCASVDLAVEQFRHKLAREQLVQRILEKYNVKSEPARDEEGLERVFGARLRRFYQKWNKSKLQGNSLDVAVAEYGYSKERQALLFEALEERYGGKEPSDFDILLEEAAQEEKLEKEKQQEKEKRELEEKKKKQQQPSSRSSSTSAALTPLPRPEQKQELQKEAEKEEEEEKKKKKKEKEEKEKEVEKEEAEKKKKIAEREEKEKEKAKTATTSSTAPPARKLGPVKNYSASERTRFKQRLTNVYKKHAPQNISKVEGALNLDMLESQIVSKVCENNKIDKKQEEAEARAAGVFPSATVSSTSSSSAAAKPLEKPKEQPKESTEKKKKDDKQKEQQDEKQKEEVTEPRSLSVQNLQEHNIKQEPAVVVATKKKDPALIEVLSAPTFIETVSASSSRQRENQEEDDDEFAGMEDFAAKFEKHKQEYEQEEEKKEKEAEEKKPQQQEKEKQTPKKTEEEEEKKKPTASSASSPVRKLGPVKNYSASEKARFKQRLTNVYKKHAPQNISKVEGALNLDMLESQIVSKVCENNKIDKKQEESEARAAGVFPSATVAAPSSAASSPIAASSSPKAAEKSKEEKAKKEQEEKEKKKREEEEAAKKKKQKEKEEEEKKKKLKEQEEAEKKKKQQQKEQEEKAKKEKQKKEEEEKAKKEKQKKEEEEKAKKEKQKKEEEEKAKKEKEEKEKKKSPSTSTSSSSSASVVVKHYNATERARFKQRLTNFYKKHAPQNLSKVEGALNMDVTEIAIFTSVCEKFKVEKKQEESEARAAGVFPSSSSSAASSASSASPAKPANQQPASKSVVSVKTPNTAAAASATSASSPPSSPASSPKQQKPSIDPKIAKEKLLVFYNKHEPSKVDRVDKLVEDYKGKYHVLDDMLKKKYDGASFLA